MVIYSLKPKDPCAEIDIFRAPPMGEPEGRLQVRERYRHLQCPVCKKVDELAALDLGVDPDVRTRTRRDVISTFCFNCIVSERFVRWAQMSGVTGLRYIPMSDGHFVLRPTMLVPVDLARSQMDFRGKPPCRGCGRFRQTCGWPDPASMELPIDPHAVFCPTLRPESHYSSHPLFLFGEMVARDLFASDLSGFWRDGDTPQYWATPGQPAAE